MLIHALLTIASLACAPDPDATRETRQTAVELMNASAIAARTNIVFDAAGLDAHVLIIHSSQEQGFSDASRCRLHHLGFDVAVNVYVSDYRIWDLTK